MTRETRRGIRVGAGLAALAAGAMLLMGGCGGIVKPEDEAAFRAALGSTSMTVYPTYVRIGAGGTHDAASAEALADWLKEQKLADVVVSSEQVPLRGEWRMNQARMFRTSVEAFSQYVREHPPTTQYAVMAEYLMGAEDRVGGVHLYFLKADGTPAFGFLQNSHHEAFQSVDPKSREDCTKVLLSAAAKYVTKAP